MAKTNLLQPIDRIHTPRTALAGRPRQKAFSLIELLLVIGIIGLLASFSTSFIRAVSGAGSVNKAITDLSGTLELSRMYAMSNHTYVRVALGQVSSSPSGLKPVLVVIPLFSASGTIDATVDTAAAMEDPIKWPALTRPLMLDNLSINDSIAPSTPNSDVIPSTSDIATINRKAGELGTVSFSSFIQFNPAGEAQVRRGEPTRYIKIGVERPAPQKDNNPFILRVSGVNGSVIILRKGEGI